ncbi:MAG: amidohydrolase family protein [Clostridiales bacterium]|jgi:predicted TIM-barrel fold metal-dependent hydrolase|nr:amidohydrolase family protein [Clostridiales bacterium]
MIIDFHAHIYPDKIAERATKNVSGFYQIPARCDGKSDTLLKIGKEAGIDKFTVHSVAQNASQVRSINTYLASVVNEHPNNFIGYGALHAGLENPAKEIDFLISLGLKGVKLHPDFQNFMMDDCRMLDIYEMLEGRLPILMHCGDYRHQFSRPERLDRILRMFPKLTVIAAHFGGWSLFDLALEYLLDKNCYLDVSSSIMFLGEKRSLELIRAYGAERILFGSDYPMWNPGIELERFNRLDLTGKEKELILSKNAMGIHVECEKKAV